jgi:3-hydroxyisobutyrate dehydrogenase-like beta-hydroxyacid dehydrogenase
MVDTSSPSDVRVGFIGLGLMGGAMATRIIKAGFPTVLWARRREALAPFGGAEHAASPADLAAAVDIVGICVWSDDDVREVFAAERGVLAGCRPGTVVVIHSTTAPETCRELARIGAERDVAVIDAPVSGGPDVALEGALVVAVGGDAATVDRCRPVFATFADLIVHLGPVGSGQVAKLVNNALFCANFAVGDDALALGEELGLDPAALAQVLMRASGRSLGVDVASRTRTSPETRERALGPLEKDVRCLTADVAPSQAAAVPLFTDAAQEAIRRLAQPDRVRKDGK